MSVFAEYVTLTCFLILDALDLGKRLLKEYDEYFGIKYPLPKLDLIAIPDLRIINYAG